MKFKSKSYINNFNETSSFFHNLFINKDHVKDIEFVDLGEKYLIRAKFWRGPFNERPILFSFQSDYTKRFYTHQLLNAVLGSLSENSAYFIVIKKNELQVDKNIECYG